MKEGRGAFRKCSALKSILPDNVGCPLSFCNSPFRYRKLDQKFERKVAEAMKNRAALVGQNFRSIKSIIMKFPQIEAGLGNIHGVFEQYDENSNGTIDHEELKTCLSKLHFELTEKDINGIYHYCDMDGKRGIQFREFMVLLCVAYVLMEPASATGNLSRMGLYQLEATFSMLVEAFLFLDKNGDGKLDKKEIIRSLGEPSPGEKSPAHITMK